MKITLEGDLHEWPALPYFKIIREMETLHEVLSESLSRDAPDHWPLAEDDFFFGKSACFRRNVTEQRYSHKKTEGIE